MEVRTGRLVYEQPPGLFAEHAGRFIVDDDDMDYNAVAESNFSLKSRSFLHRVNDRVRKMLDQSSKTCNTRQQQTFFILRKVYVFDIGSICIHGKELLRKFLHSIKNTGKDLTMKQMFDISEKLIVGQSDEIFGVSQISWDDSSWKQLSLVSDEEVISLSHAKVYAFSDSVFCLGKINQNPTSNTDWEETFELVRQFTTVQSFGHN